MPFFVYLFLLPPPPLSLPKDIHTETLAPRTVLPPLLAPLRTVHPDKLHYLGLHPQCRPTRFLRPSRVLGGAGGGGGEGVTALCALLSLWRWRVPTIIASPHQERTRAHPSFPVPTCAIATPPALFFQERPSGSRRNCSTFGERAGTFPSTCVKPPSVGLAAALPDALRGQRKGEAERWRKLVVTSVHAPPPDQPNVRRARGERHIPRANEKPTSESDKMDMEHGRHTKWVLAGNLDKGVSTSAVLLAVWVMVHGKDAQAQHVS